MRLGHVVQYAFGMLVMAHMAILPPALCETIRVTYDREASRQGIQKALNSLKDQGGVVLIPAGTYVLRAPLDLTGFHEGIVIRGEGPATVLRPDPEEYTLSLTANARKGQGSLTVQDASSAKTGDVLLIHEEKSNGSSPMKALVASVEGNTVILDRPLNSDYLVRNDARARHTTNVFFAESCSSVVIRDLRIAGNMRDVNARPDWQGNTAILLNGNNLTVDAVEVTNVPGDGICLSGSGEFRITDCRIENVAGRGLHIGGDPRVAILSRNFVKKAGHYGIYLCDGCQRVDVTDNVITYTGEYETPDGTVSPVKAVPVDVRQLLDSRPGSWSPETDVAGIGGLGAGKDAYDNISNNIILRSRGAGIAFQRWNTEQRPGNHINIVGNTITEAATAGISLLAAEVVNVASNLISDCGTGVSVRKSTHCVVRGNLIEKCRRGIEIFSTEPALPSEKNVIQANTTVSCRESIWEGPNSRQNIISDNDVLPSRP